MAQESREQRLEDAILRAILVLDKFPALAGYSDSIIYSVDDLIAALKAAVRKN